MRSTNAAFVGVLGGNGRLRRALLLLALLLVPASLAQDAPVALSSSLSALRVEPGAGGSVFLDVAAACVDEPMTVTLEPVAPPEVSVEILPGFHVFEACEDGLPDPRTSEARVALDEGAAPAGSWPVTIRAKAYAGGQLAGEASARFDVLDRRGPPAPVDPPSPTVSTPPPSANDAPGFGLLVALAAAGLAVASKKR